MKVVTILGARPQFIKAAPVSRALAKAGAEERIVHTGQHYDANMSDLFFNEMGLPAPAYNLGISNLGHGAMTGRMLEQVEEVLLTEKPDCVLVYGDTNSTLAGALAAAKLHIPVAHVEAGLRSFNMQMPEEINRILTDRIAQVLFCPTDAAVANLEREGFRHFGVRIERTGDVMFDAALFYRDQATKRPLPKDIPGSGFVLATLHRAENTDDASRLRSLTEALGRVNAIAPVVMPLHPRTRARIKSLGWTLAGTVIDPVGYLDMLNLLDRCSLVLTDSGGLQKEAYFFEKPCVTVRDQTEWTELVEAGVNKVVGADPSAILEAVNTLISNPPRFTKGLYGDGSAAEVIARVLSSPG
jgi:UDP-GlcNAc3NAcA epimerase